ncbi:unnamed protein product [Brassicogethes aeneus]|uniref:Uncharacterized protein n=1 Tax=Brassicogethes aeneus TaxID=1431903 RepID=A0A9P0B6C0_BRAAE|nr:unnamed protein product [Brassicogethes aeneus]
MYQKNNKSVPLVESVNNTEDEEIQQSQVSSYSSNSFESIYQTKSQEINAINSLLNILEIDPVDKDKMSTKRFKQKMEQLLLDFTQKITEKINTAYDLDINIINDTVTKNIVTDSKSLKEIIFSLQNRFDSAKAIDEKIQILTILPKRWKFNDVKKYFNCTNYIIREFRKSKETDDGLMVRKRKKYTKISKAMNNAIKNYYLDENNCYTCPGIKQYKRKRSDSEQIELVQKKLLLYTLRDLYNNFVNDYTGDECLPKFSYFATLKPEECVYAGDPGTHEICVCAEHENIKLKVSALRSKFNYRDLITASVCSTDSRECMLHECKNCPGIKGMRTWIKEFNFDLQKSEINFKRWDTAGSRAFLANYTEKTCQQLNKVLSGLISINLIPGEKLCRECDKALHKMYQKNNKSVPLVESVNNTEDEEIQQSQVSSYSSNSFESIYQTKSQEINAINSLLNILEIDPVDKDKMSTKRFKQKMEQLLLDFTQKITEKINTAYDLDINIINDTVTKNIVTDSKSLKEIIFSLQNRFDSAKAIDEKIQILTILPKRWKFNDVKKYFNCTNYIIREFRKSKETDDGLMVRKRKKYTKISKAMNNAIKNYYLDENNCYTCPGIKQYKRKRSDSEQIELVQKKLLLYTLRDLYNNFVNDYTGDECLPKFSYFATLKPEECVYAGDPGTHEICVCAEHENIKLKVSALRSKFNYRDLITASVCSTDSRECMLHECKNCPGIKGMRTWIKEFNFDLQKSEINFKRWDTAGSRAFLANYTESKSSFLDNLFSDVWNLTLHSYIADSQKIIYLIVKKNCKLILV